MNRIINSLPSWARAGVGRFLADKTSPLKGAEPRPLSSTDAQIYESLILDQSTRLTKDDQKPGDRDDRPGRIQKDVFRSGLTENVHFRSGKESVEVAYDFGEGHHAQYLVNDPDKAVYVDMVQSGHAHNLAVFIDKNNPAKSVLFTLDVD